MKLSACSNPPKKYGNEVMHRGSTMHPRLQKLETERPTGNFVNLGCGDVILEYWINIDKYSDNPVVFVHDLDNIPQFYKHFDLAYSCHSLEHVSLEKAKNCLKEWNIILKPGGKLIISVPDITKVCELFPSDPNWYIQCLYGMQTGPGHVHKFGYTEEILKDLIESSGFEITMFDRFFYGDCPAFWVEARKI